MARFWLLIYLAILFSIESAQAGGFTFDFATGLPNVQLKNSDGSLAYYSGFSFNARLHMPILGGDRVSIDLTAAARYQDLENNNSSNTQTEVAKQFGYGPGISANFSRFFIGGEYLMLKEKHYWVGPVTEKSEVDFNAISYYAGVDFELLNKVSLSLSYQMTQGTQPKNSVIPNDVPYKDEIIWLHLRIDTEASTKKALGILVD